MATQPLSSLDARTLARRLGELAGDERRVQVEFLRHLDEFDRRRAWVDLGYGSLWTYCLEALHLREGSAGRRIGAMKVLRRFPGLAEPLRDGRLCLSTLARPVLHEAIRCGIEKYGKRKGAVKPSRKVAPKATPPKDPAAIPAEVRRQVWERDGGCCAWTGPDGRRCNSRWQLEVDHLDPAGRGGKATLDRCRLLCRMHDILYAEQVYGREHMRKYRKGEVTIAGDSNRAWPVVRESQAAG